MKIRTAAPAIAALLAVSALAAGAQAAELLVNGDFESGVFSPWGVGSLPEGNGAWIVNGNGQTAPASGQSVPTLAGGGSFIALADQSGPGTHILQQDFDAVAGGTYVFSFDAWSGNTQPVAFGDGIEFNGPPNQHFEVHLMGPDDITLFSGDLAHSWTHQNFDISSYITTSDTYTVAFIEVNNQGTFNQGIDNVSVMSVDAPTGGVPEPASWTLMLSGFAGLGAVLRSRRRAASAA